MNLYFSTQKLKLLPSFVFFKGGGGGVGWEGRGNLLILASKKNLTSMDKIRGGCGCSGGLKQTFGL